MIVVEDLVKEFRRIRRAPGRLGSVRTLLARRYDTVRAVDGIAFSVEPGEVVGYLGPNGAGKSTTIKMMTGILVPTSGSVTVNGLVPWRQRERNALHIGVVFGQRSQLWWDLPLRDSFELIAKMYRMTPAAYRRNLDRFTETLDMAAFLDQPVRQLSLGQRMRGDLAAAMLYEPAVLYLDEPTIGLDVVAKERMRGFVKEINRESGTTVVLTTHDFADVEQLCRRIILIDHGRIRYDGGVAELKAHHSPRRLLTVRFDDSGSRPRPRLDELGLLPGVELVEHSGIEARMRFDAGRTSIQALIAAVEALCPITDLATEEPDLEDVFHEIYNDRARA